ncbi:MAG: DUF177 domain-containing protein [Bdellovibrionota bacterium]
MKIHLKEIKEEGQSYSLNRKTAELNETLKDLIQNNDYFVEFHIRPINSRDFQLIGSLKAATNEDCSKCGIPFQFSIRENFNEILIPPQPMDRGGKYSKVNHISEGAQEGPSSYEYSEGAVFDASEYVHEMVGLAIPLNPRPEPLESGACSICGDDKFCQPFKYDEAPEDFKPKNPFEALKNVKLS